MTYRYLHGINNAPPRARLTYLRRESGMVLVVGLVLLVVLTLVGVTAMQSTTLEERMSGNYAHRISGFQTAETGLRRAEQTVATSSPAFDNTGGYYKAPVPGDPPRWRGIYGPGAQAGSGATIQLGGNLPGSYFIERLPAAVTPGQSLSAAQYANQGARQLYRITASGSGPAHQSNVILQSVFKP